MGRFTAGGTLALVALSLAQAAHGQVRVDAADTLFNRFLRRTVVTPPGSQKFRVMYLAGDQLQGAGLSGAVPLDLAPPDRSGLWLSHDLSTLAYKLPAPGSDDGPASFSASYGLGVHRVPYLGSVHAGLYFNYAASPRPAPARGDDTRTLVAPYLYLDRGHSADEATQGLSYSGFLLPNASFDRVEKAQLTLGWQSDWLELGLWYEYTRRVGGPMQEYSLFGRVFDAELPDGGIHGRLGNAFPADEDITGGFADPERLFVVVDLSYLFAVGLSYRDDLGVGFRAGVDYTLAFAPGETLTAQLYYAHDYINDLVLGQIADPSMWVIGVGYTR
ncbi:MAG: hypothetical protein H6702_23760 [Myxococcales bacterium]|nr:hypothetical protein [Myxococcales bacterium]